MARKDVQVLVFGEALCDLFARRAGTPIAETDVLVPHLGGAPANVSVQLARLGVRSGLVTAVGPDPFGVRLLRLLAAEGVDTSAIRTIPGRRTGVTLVEVDSDGERRFFGFREGSADLALAPADVRQQAVTRMLRSVVIVHSGTVSLKTDSARDATTTLQAAGRKRGAAISLDVNLRPGMYPSMDELLLRARAAVHQSDIVKATREEALLVADGRVGRAGVATAAARLLAMGPRLVLVTDGERPLCVASQAATVTVDVSPVRAVDATGAGDAFMGAALATLVTDGVGVADLGTLEAASLRRLGDSGRRAGAAAVRALGATTSMMRQRRARTP